MSSTFTTSRFPSPEDQVDPNEQSPGAAERFIGDIISEANNLSTEQIEQILAPA